MQRWRKHRLERRTRNEEARGLYEVIHYPAHPNVCGEHCTLPGLVRTVKLGLVRYVAKTPVAERLAITYQAPVEAAPGGPAEDRWNLWVFTINVGGNLSGESQQRSLSGNGTVQADRTGEDLKLDFRVSTRLSRSETDVPELDTTFVNTQERFNFDALTSPRCA